ncbi:hypothetical protein VMCG_09081 [Cytospora schulzeri]|uniref:Zn(2)-C6 fungal-type domain-containing protein n=1 Tax=Cytospora schulzeri TaxID=448051 RepID=A0A423VP12_9PEZI|nr:hypothetical protein VMCG_09081 [Valsa malicola]
MSGQEDKGAGFNGCDETRPVCNQCTKSRRHCSGYRSDFDILHRDETQATAARARKSEAKKAAKRAAEEGRPFTTFESTPPENTAQGNGAWEVTLVSPGSSASSAPAISSTTTSHLEVACPTAAPAVPLHQRASHFFAWNFIMVPAQRGRNSGHLEYLLPLLNAESRADSPFQLAYSACALAAMSNRLKADTMDLMELSFMQHSRALLAVNKALRNPSESKTDSTLATVLLLSLFEKITAAKEIGMLAWRTHIEGAMQLVRSRGKEMVRSKVSVLLFNAVRMQIIARTLSSGTSTGMGVNWWLPESVAEDSIGARCQRFSLETSDLRAEVTRLMASLPRNDQGLDIMLEMLRKVQGLDHRIASWLRSLPAEYQPTPLYWEDKVLGDGEAKHTAVYPGRVDVYYDLMIANAWNASRSTRIILMSLLIRVAAWLCSPADFRSTPEYATAVRTSKTNIADIISTVPYMLRMHRANIPYPGTSAPGAFACGDDEQSKMLGGLMVAWPLSTVRTSDYTTDEQRDWAVGRLNFIANELGVKYASSLAAAKIRFPSMLIRRDGLMPAKDPLLDIQQTLSKVVPVR